MSFPKFFKTVNWFCKLASHFQKNFFQVIFKENNFEQKWKLDYKLFYNKLRSSVKSTCSITMSLLRFCDFRHHSAHEQILFSSVLRMVEQSILIRSLPSVEFIALEKEKVHVCKTLKNKKNLKVLIFLKGFT